MKNVKKNVIEFDFNNLMSERIGGEHGLKAQEIEGLFPQCKNVIGNLDKSNWGFMKLPFDNNVVRIINKKVNSLKNKFNCLVVLGIGGSALGNRMLYSALPPKDKKKRVIILDNVDPDTIHTLIKEIDYTKTLFNVITKSGGTVETMSCFMIFRKLLIDKLGVAKHKEHIILTTDPEKGLLREIAKQEGYYTLDIPSSVGGRFSVLSSVGLLSAAFCGTNIKEILEGAKHADELCRENDIWSNPACISAIVQYLFYKKGRNICVFMPYSGRLKDLSEWFAQLWAESLGKKETVGSTPVKALGVTDQHSQLQLYMAGPHDKVIVFVRVAKCDNTVKIPNQFKNNKQLNYLAGHTINELMLAEQKGTELALTKNSRPNYTITFDKVTPFNIGSIIYLLEMQTAVAGELFEIDAFNQPGVELSKQLTSAFLGRPGYELKKKEIENIPALKQEYIIAC